MDTKRCYRFVSEDLRSAHGKVTWTIGEWIQAPGKVVACVNGLHAAATPRESIRYAYGTRWFVAEARGTIIHYGGKLVASEMRLVEEIPVAILRRFAIDCARDCLEHAADRGELEALLDATEAEIARKRAEVARALNPSVGAAAGRAVAAAMAASFAAVVPHPAAWVGAAAANAFAAQTAAEAGASARSAADAVAGAFDAVAALAAAEAIDRAATAAHVAAAAAGAAHAASVAAAHGVPVGETADPYAASRVPRPVHPAYEAQSRKLLQLVAEG